MPTPAQLSSVIAVIAVDQLYPELVETLKHRGAASVSSRILQSAEYSVEVELRGYEFDPWNFCNVHTPTELRTAVIENESICGLVSSFTDSSCAEPYSAWVLFCIKTGSWSYTRLVLTVRLQRVN